MDDFNISSLHESKNEWGSRLLVILTPHIIDGLKSIFEEALKLCRENNEIDKYLMTFQNFITRIPKWNANIIDIERKRIVEKSGCGYLEDLVTCVHIIQLKLLSAIRVGQKQKKIDINIPKLDDFIHKIYVNVARKIYKNVYLFEINIQPLQIQKNHRELEIVVQECILNTVRDSIPVEAILQAYMDETIEEDVQEEIKEQVIENPNKNENTKASVPPQIIKETEHEPVKNEEPEKPRQLESTPINKSFENSSLSFPELTSEKSQTLSFNNVDFVKDSNNNELLITAPKNVERLEELSTIRNAQRKIESQDDSDEEERVKIQIYDQTASLDNLDIHNIDFPDLKLDSDDLFNDIEVLV